MTASNLERSSIFIFFFVLFCLGTSIFRDYGVSFDEDTDRALGANTYNYVVYHDPALFNFYDKDYGPVFQEFLAVIEKFIDPSGLNTQKIYYMRHFMIFLTFYVSVVFFYRICRKYFNDRILGLLGCVMLVTCPRIFAHAFFNSKDIPFLSLTIMAAWSALNFLDRPSWGSALVHAFFCALAVDARIAGILMVAYTVILSLLQAIVFPRHRSLKDLGALGFYLLCTAAFIVLMWPELWPHPWHNFVVSLEHVSHFRWHKHLFYMGQWLIPFNRQLPWHYLPCWIMITVPLVFLGLFLIGAIHTMCRLAAEFKEVAGKPLVLLALMWFFIPVLMVIILKPVIYDNWRHEFFIYPAMVLLALAGYNYLAQDRKVVTIILTFFIYSNVGASVYAMSQLHPYEHLYFNGMTGFDLQETRKKFQLDLWNVQFRAPLEFIIKNDLRPHINVYCFKGFAAISNAQILPLYQRERLNFVPGFRRADYYIMDEDFVMDRPFGRARNWLGEKVFTLRISGHGILSVYKADHKRNYF